MSPMYSAVTTDLAGPPLADESVRRHDRGRLVVDGEPRQVRHVTLGPVWETGDDTELVCVDRRIEHHIGRGDVRVGPEPVGDIVACPLGDPVAEQPVRG